MDPTSDLAASNAGGVAVKPPKKRGKKSKKASIINEIQAKCRHLYSIPEEFEVEEQGKYVLMGTPDECSHASSIIHAISKPQSKLPFKAG